MAKHLGKAFEEVVERWNGQEYIKLLKSLHPKFIMKKVDDAGSIVSGVDNVEHYMTVVQKPQHPLFNPADGWTEKHWPDKTVGQVRGTGTYQDNSVEKTTPLKVRFTFTFKRKHDDEDWLLINAFAAEM